MNTLRDPDAVLGAWLDDGPATLPDETRQAIAVGIRMVTRRRTRIGWPFGGPPTNGLWRLASVLGGAAVVVMAAGLTLNLLANQLGVGTSVPATDPRSPFVGVWISTSDADGSTQTMTVRASADGAVEIVVLDDIATVCSATPSTMTGTGRLKGTDALVIPTPDYTCDDGSEPQALGGPPLEEQLQNLTFSYDAKTKTLTDNFGGVWLRESASDPSQAPGPSEQVAPPSEAEVNQLLNGFLAARIAGEGAQQYLHSLYPDILWEDIPLLYATSSGAPYERAEFEPVPGIEWPYGFRAFKVRLFAGDTVVEQLFFMPHDDPDYFPADGRLGLEYQPHGFATHIAPTTEDGQPVAVTYSYFDGEVTLHAAHPWIFFNGDESLIFSFGRLIPEGPGVGPTTDGGQRSDWDELRLIPDPAPRGADCQIGPSPADARALAESIRSDPGVEATAPVAVNVGGTEALMMDVKIAAGATVCEYATSGGDLLWNGVLTPVFDVYGPYSVANGLATGRATGEWMRLYLLDVPAGSSMRILAIAIVAPESRFERAVEAATPVVGSIEFHAR